MPVKTTLGGRMVFDSVSKVESARSRPGHQPLVRFHSAPILAPAPPAVATSSSACQEPKEEVEAFPEECNPGSGHCTPPVRHEVEEETAADAGSDATTLGSANDGSDDEMSSLSEIFCRTAASIERSWAAVKRAKQQRPTWMRWWSF